MYLGFYEENDICPEPKCNGKLYYPPVENCSCHLNPPCSACTDNRIRCDKCGYEPEEPKYKDVPVVFGSPGISMREYKLRPLDNNKIDYNTKMHTHFSQICEGVYPNGTTLQEVEAAIRGTFGGRFEYFGNGKFKYISYTD